MRIIEAEIMDTGLIYEVVQKVINEIYPRYYPNGIVEFFSKNHSKENIEEAIKLEYVILLEIEGEIVGTGSLGKKEIKRIFILPEYQKRGYGKILLEKLEEKAEEIGYNEVTLSSSLSGYLFYEKNGYKQIKYNRMITESGDILCFGTMAKKIISKEFEVNYNNKKFISTANTENGEVSGQTIFNYYQDNDVIWGEYSGGLILKGYLVGKTDKKGNLHFYYEHINDKKEIKSGKCNSTPKILSNGKIQLLEEWEWTSGDKSKGSSTIQEID